MSNALPVIGAVVGGVVGFFVGGPAGAVIGAGVGSTLGSAIAGPQSTTVKLPNVEGPRLSDLRIQTSSYGKVIPEIYGQGRIAGNVIWAQPIKEVKIETTHSSTQSGGKGGGSSQTTTQTQTTFEYFATLAIAICEGPIDEIIRAYADAKVLDDNFLGASDGKYNIHLGDETQLPDAIIESFEGAGNVPAYRGIAYVVMQDFPLAAFGNRIPNFTFELKRTVRSSPAVEDKIKDMVLIPGAGEFVYAPTVYTQQDGETVGGTFVAKGTKSPLNMHNYDNVANVTLALDNLQKTFPNLESVALVVTWFATSTDAGACTIIPKVEFLGEAEILPEGWSVAGLTRSTAQAVLTFGDGTPTYGGTPSDKTVVDLCVELKNRGLSVLLYPMIFVDQITPDPKPWRGRITSANATDANNWFTKTNGFNAFIRHYSQLSVGGVNLKDNIDSFIIGSELVGMTSFTDTPGNYPAVNQLVTLAGLVQTDLSGTSVQVGYAADWSEYHHADGGWFNMDPLWASSDIDFVGIDWYAPLTPDLPQSQITEEKIIEGFEKDEGWDYFWNNDRTVQTSFGGDPTYAWKNVEYWWKNTHTNPDMSGTAWTAKMKPIVFTEFGFPSVDGAANQPNVFYDPSSSESFFPRGSKGRVDFQAQREAINAALDFLDAREQEAGNTGLVAKRYLWTWDARPFSFWPDLTNVWADGALWKTGHWVNGKLGNSTLGAIIADMLSDVGMQSTDYDVTRLTDTVDGYVRIQLLSVREAIEQLQAAYFFDVVESDGLLKFVKRGGQSVLTIENDDLVPISKDSNIRDTLETVRTQELELPREVSVTYISRTANYDPAVQRTQRQAKEAKDKVNMNLPLVLTDQQAKITSDVTLYNTWIQRVKYRFIVSAKYSLIEPADIVTLNVDGVAFEVRVTTIKVDPNGLTEIEASAEDVASYDFYTPPGEPVPVEQPGQIIPETRLELLDIPAMPGDTEPVGIMRVALAPIGDNWKGAVVYRSDDGGESGGNTFNVLVASDADQTIGGATTILPAPTGFVNNFDLASTVDVLLLNGSLISTTELGVLNGANVALIGNEIIQFQNATLIDTNKYRLSKLLRGRLGTEHEVGTHALAETFVFLAPGISRVAMQNSLIGLSRFYKPVSIGDTPGNTPEQSFIYTAKTLRPYSPVHIKGTRNIPASNDWTITWVRRTRFGGEWRDGVDIPLNEESELYHVEIMNGGTPVRTVEGITSPSLVYNEAQQITDFGSAQSSITTKIYQISATVGRGVAGIATL